MKTPKLKAIQHKHDEHWALTESTNCMYIDTPQGIKSNYEFVVQCSGIAYNLICNWFRHFGVFLSLSLFLLFLVDLRNKPNAKSFDMLEMCFSLSLLESNAKNIVDVWHSAIEIIPFNTFCRGEIRWFIWRFVSTTWQQHSKYSNTRIYQIYSTAWIFQSHSNVVNILHTYGTFSVPLGNIFRFSSTAFEINSNEAIAQV